MVLPIPLSRTLLKIDLKLYSVSGLFRSTTYSCMENLVCRVATAGSATTLPRHPLSTPLWRSGSSRGRRAVLTGPELGGGDTMLDNRVFWHACSARAAALQKHSPAALLARAPLTRDP